uniref:heparan-sulfate 6-O-sulfotransferase 1 isoform X2 n=1 Tax=Ciona intestinalis TaxID=7719 RepID=UPI000EF48710|nr:heparan-sulfate 6-O-sulfotransferase 1 isoform X2 [Ciona intestinalis]|eukprot:XP_026690725.1 heparan-sulfate 6-O-sulfotransferase 1 isoform X2 [Ciona intestinalis]
MYKKRCLYAHAQMGKRPGYLVVSQEDGGAEYMRDGLHSQNAFPFYFMIQNWNEVLREPVARFLSEWGHVRRAATWDQHKFLCNKVQTPQKVCWGEALDWRNASLEEFINCDINFGRNRQTRMLADLKLVNCSAFGDEEHDRIMLKSAKHNLMSMPFFGLAERQVDSQALFEQTFGIKFTKQFVDKSETHVSNIVLDEEVSDKIRKLNHLDVQLYKYAKEIFARRYERIRKDKQK